jgi:hypothetical protein
MSWKSCAVVCALSGTVCSPALAGAGDPASGAGRDLAAEVRAVFRVKCAHCHGPQVHKPRAGFGYVIDLRRLAADADKVVPFKPDESGLWQQVANEEMPPPNSPSGPLTAQQKEVIRAWIAAGAPGERPVAERSVGHRGRTPPPEANDPPAAPGGWGARVWLGKFRVPLVYFTLALLVAALVGEVRGVWKGRGVPSAAVCVCLGLAAVAAVAAVVLG